MQLKYMGSKSWLAPHVDRLLGDVAVLHSPFFGSGKLEYYLAARRPALAVRGVDAFEPCRATPGWPSIRSESPTASSRQIAVATCTG